MNSYAFRKDLKGRVYQDVLAYALQVCTEALVVIRPEISLSEKARAVITHLRRFQVQGASESPWLGMQLFDTRAEVLRFHFHTESLAFIEENTVRLFEWEQPALPEDLCLFRATGQDWLVSRAHGKSGYFLMTREEKAALTAAIPKLAAIVGSAG